jgi:hypothetical protein
MTKEELEKATGQELIGERDYCGVDGYYGDYLDNVNAEMLKRFNRLAELEKENAELKKQDELKIKVIKGHWQDGAEFGYNKGNEWHYVKDKDYPKDNKPVLCILGDIDSENCEVGYYNDVGSGEPWHFETYQLPDDDGDNAWGVYAWKEIVLPKESE